MMKQEEFASNQNPTKMQELWQQTNSSQFTLDNALP